MDSAVKESLFEKVKEVVEMWGLKKYFRFYENTCKIVCKLNGNSFLKKGLYQTNGQSGAAKSIVNPTDVLIEEADEITEDEYSDLVLSLRGSEDIEEILCFNPPDVDHWIIKRFFPPLETFERTDGRFHYINATTENTTILHTTFLDNPYCTTSERQKHEEERIKRPKRFLRTGLGLLSRRDNTGAALPEFERGEHVSDRAKFDPETRVLIAYDFNRLPFHTVGIWQFKYDQIERKFFAYLVKEFCLPDNSIRETQKAVNAWLIESGYKLRVVRIVADFSGTAKRDHDTEAHVTRVVKTAERKFRVINETRPNPPVASSLEFVNDMFGGNITLSSLSNYPNAPVLIRINSSCSYHIQDFELCKATKDGKIVKSKKRKTVTIDGVKTKIEYQIRGHGIDSARYALTSALEEEFIEYRKE